MDYVNAQVAIGGDVNNTVPKFRVPVSEIPVLAAIHGPDALTEFEQCDAPDGAEDLSNRDEMQRLHSIYGRTEDGEGNPVLRGVYPGAGAKVVTSIDDLDIPEGAMKVTERAVVKKEPAAKKQTAKADAKADAKDDNPDVMG